MSAPPRTVAVATGSRADFGLLRPVLRAILAHPALRLRVVVTGAHLLPPAMTAEEVEAEFEIDARITMQTAGGRGRGAYAAALGRGVAGFAEYLAQRPADLLLVLGDRIEPFAAAVAGAAIGIHVAHLHGGDRAEGVADESWRHALSKLAHVHLPATRRSARRLIRMGEDAARVHVVGSPAIDGLAAFAPLEEPRWHELGSPRIVFLMHPTGEDATRQRSGAAAALAACMTAGPTIALHPNDDPGREEILAAIEDAGCRAVTHLDRATFIGLLRRADLVVGNSSAGLIEGAALGVRCLNLGPRQAGREKPANVTDLLEWSLESAGAAVRHLCASPPAPARHPYGAGDAGPRTAEILAKCDRSAHGLRKLNTY